MKQTNLFKPAETEDQQKYTGKIESPVYMPKNKQPHILELCDDRKTTRLINEIEESAAPDDVKAFLIKAASRHIVFNYEKIADYYAHADKSIQHLFERSALVIIDFEQAIEYGYVQLCDDIKNKYLQEYEK